MHVSCWEDGLDHERPGTTCLLPDGHVGDHEWTPDSEILIDFVGDAND